MDRCSGFILTLPADFFRLWEQGEGGLLDWKSPILHGGAELGFC